MPPFRAGLSAHTQSAPSDCPLANPRWILSTSVTHMEIQHGALRSGNPNAAFFVRDDAVYDSIPQPHLPSFVEDTPYAVAAMAELKRQLRQRFPGQVVDYSPSVSGVEVISGMEKVHLAGLEAFAEEVYDFLTSAIERQVRPQQPKPACGSYYSSLGPKRTPVRRRLWCHPFLLSPGPWPLAPVGVYCPRSSFPFHLPPLLPRPRRPHARCDLLPVILSSTLSATPP